VETADLYDYLLRAKTRNVALVLTFDDGDKYSLGNVDLCYSIGRDGLRETEPLRVSFDTCMNDSHKRLQAHRDGHLKTAGVFWTSTDPIEPVDMEYGVENLITVWDDDKSYVVYDRDGGSKTM
jgi:hypothetical protein